MALYQEDNKAKLNKTYIEFNSYKLYLKKMFKLVKHGISNRDILSRFHKKYLKLTF